MRAAIILLSLNMCIVSGSAGTCHDINLENHRSRHPIGDQWCKKNSSGYGYLDPCMKNQDALQPLATKVGQGYDLDRGIAEANKLLELYLDQQPEYIPMGTLNDSLEVYQHGCWILGVTLGKEDDVAHLYIDHNDLAQFRNDNYDLDERTIEIAFAKLSLNNWISSAENIREMPVEARKEIWNLNCVGRRGISAKAYSPRDTEDTFYEWTGYAIKVLGPIETGFTAKLSRAISEHPNATEIILGSGGGSVKEAIDAGRLIRRNQMTTTLSSYCYSACTLVFLGGSKRELWDPVNPQLGFHMVSRNGVAIPTSDPVYDLIKDYAREMGVDPQGVVYAMHQAAPDSFYYPEHEFNCDKSIATWIKWVGSCPPER